MSVEDKKFYELCDEIKKILDFSLTHKNFFSSLLLNHEEIIQRAFLASAVSNRLIELEADLKNEFGEILDFLKENLDSNSYEVIEVANG